MGDELLNHFHEPKEILQYVENGQDKEEEKESMYPQLIS